MSLTGMLKLRSSACLLYMMVRPLSAFHPMAGSTACHLTSSSLPTKSAAAHSTCSSSLSRSGLAYQRRNMSSSSSSSGNDGGDLPPIRHINKAEMKQILMEHEEMISADAESPYFVVDVRTPGEVQQTGKLSPSVPTLPVQVMIPPYNCLQMEDEEFEEAFGFVKPPKDITMVFSCAAGIRSVSACKAAQAAGYKNCVNYMGGASEWFYS